MSIILKTILLFTSLFVSGCVVVPVDVTIEAPLDLAKCSAIEHKKELELVNINDQDTGYYFSVVGFLLSPILIPASTLISGSYVLLHNASLSEETVRANEDCMSASLSKPDKS
jgi:hypothetical protein